MTSVLVFYNRFQMGLRVCVGCRGIASKVIDFLLQYILQQPLLSLLTITVRGHWISEGGQLMVTSVPALNVCECVRKSQYGD